MKNNPNENRDNIIEWKLNLSKNIIIPFRFPVFQNENREREGSDNKSDNGSDEGSNPALNNDLLGIFQDTFYVTNYASIIDENEPEYTKSELDVRDEYWNIFRWIWHKFNDVLHDGNGIINFQDSGDFETLSKKKGKGYKQSVEKMGEPFVTRYKLYDFASLFWSKNYIRKTYGSCTELICQPLTFLKFWNGILNFLSIRVSELQKDNVKNLKSKFEQILKVPETASEYKKFKNRFLNGNGCFSLTEVNRKDGLRQDLLCFSGVRNESTNVARAIDKIVKSGRFHNPKLVQVTDNIRYYLICGEYITYGEAKKCHYFLNHNKSNGVYYNRMFSCCERKTFADYNWNECASYKMIVKYAPCEICRKPVTRHKKKYNGKVFPKETSTSGGSLPFIGEFDRLAKCICSGHCAATLHCTCCYSPCPKTC